MLSRRAGWDRKAPLAPRKHAVHPGLACFRRVHTGFSVPPRARRKHGTQRAQGALADCSKDRMSALEQEIAHGGEIASPPSGVNSAAITAASVAKLSMRTPPSPNRKNTPIS